MTYRSTLEQGGSGGIFSDNNAVSTVIGAILLLGLVVSCVAFVEVHYVPSWGADDEARHLRDVFVDFSTVPDRIDTLALANDTDLVSKQRIKLGIGDMPLIAPGKSWGTIGAVPREGNFTVEADVWMVNITGNDSNGTITTEGVNITNISSVSRFYIYIEHDKHHHNWDGEIFVNFTNPSGGVKLELVPGCKEHLKISTWNSNGDKIVDGIYIDRNVTARHSSRDYRVDLLNPSYGFNKVLSDADTPYNLTITKTTTVSEACSYYIIYNECNRSIMHYSATSNGTLIYKSMNRYFLDQKFIYQNGAIFLCQPPNVTMRIAPGIIIENATNGIARIMIPMVTIGTGVNRTHIISGSGVEELQMRLGYADRTTFADGNNTENVRIIIEPPEGSREFRNNYLQEWADYFNATVAWTSVKMPKPVYGANNSNININLTGNIHLELKDIEIEGKIATVT